MFEPVINDLVRWSKLATCSCKVVFPVFDVAYRFQKVADVLIRMTKNIGIHGIAGLFVNSRQKK
jgi:hypothetical protein